MLSFLRKKLTIFLFVSMFFVHAGTASALPPLVALLPAGAGAASKALGWLGVGLTGAKAVASGVCLYNIESCISFILNYILYFFVWVANFFLQYLIWLMGWILNYTFYYTVANFTQSFTEFQSGQSGNDANLIYYAWSIVRDILNTGVFFVIIYHAIRTMFKGFDDIKKKFIGLLVFVVLVNFSLLFVKLVADVSNVAMLQLYEAVAKPVSGETRESFLTHRDGGSTGISDFVINAINPTSAVSQAIANKTTADNISQGTKTFAFQLALLVMNAYLVFLFLYLTAIFITRAITFIVVMVLSPFLVAGMFYSGLEDSTKKIKSELLEEALQGPGILLFLILSAMVASRIFSVDSFVNVNSGFAQNSGVLAANLPMLFKVSIFALFNYYAFKMIRQLTTNGNNYAEKFLGFGLAGAFGLTAYGLRKGVGGAANSLLQNERVGGRWKDTAQDKEASAAQRFFARSALKTSGFLSNSTFDARGGISMLGKTALGAKVMAGLKAGVIPNLDIGKASKTTTVSRQESKLKKAKERRESWKALSAEGEISDWTVSNSALLREGLVKKEIDDEEVDMKTYADAINEGRAERASILDRITSATNNKDYTEETLITSNGESKTRAEWMKKLAEIKSEEDRKVQIVNEAMAEIEKDPNKKAKLVAAYKEKVKDRRGDRFDEMQSRDEIKYMAEMPRRFARSVFAKLSGEKVITSTQNANYAHQKAIDKRTKPDSQTRQRIATLVRNSISLSRLAQADVLTEDQKTLLTKDLNKISSFASKGNTYTKGKKADTLDKQDRDEVLSAMDNIFSELQKNSLNSDLLPDGKFKTFNDLNKSHSDNVESFASADEKAKGAGGKSGDAKSSESKGDSKDKK